MRDRCDTCFGLYLYEVDGVTYSREIRVENPESYDGVLLMLCPFCGTYSHRFGKTHPLYPRAEKVLSEIVKAKL